jgi:hypothetical protein
LGQKLKEIRTSHYATKPAYRPKLDEDFMKRLEKVEEDSRATGNSVEWTEELKERLRNLNLSSTDTVDEE